MTTFMSRFAEYVFVAQTCKSIQDKFDVAVAGGYISAQTDRWIVIDGNFEYEQCDFIAPGALPAFLKENDAKTCAELLDYLATVQHRQREGVEYWIID